jgi:ParB-like chromosome segregation protein Spo0J
MLGPIDTMEQFHAAKAAMQPVFITSRRHGRIPVPCMTPLLVRVDLVVENLYNPNSVSPEKMDLLRQSVLDNGFCFPIVTIWDEEQGCFVVIDGAHRRMILGPDWLDCDYIPVVVLPHGMAQRLAATWQFNKARGVHQVDLDAELIRALLGQGLDEEAVAERLGVDLDTVHRYKQVTGIAELFKGTDWSRAWEMTEEPDQPRVAP